MEGKESYKRISKMVLRYDDKPIRIRMGAQKELEIRKIGEKFYLMEVGLPEDIDLNNSEGVLNILDGQTLLLGRMGLASQCFKMLESISRHHLFIEREGNAFMLIDLHSTNGTFVMTADK